MADEPPPNPLQELFDLYHDKGPIWPSIPATAIMLIVAITGIFGNLSVVYGTWKNKSLHGTCNYLLALACFFDAMHMLTLFFLSYVMFTATNFVPFRLCVIVQSVPILGIACGIILTFFVAFDRVFSVVFPMQHRSLNVPTYLSVLVVICLAYSAWFLYVVHSFAIHAPAETQVPCAIVDAMPQYVGDYFFMTVIVMCVLTVACYVTVGLILKLKAGANESTRKIFKSLVVISGVVVVGWMVNAVMRVALSALHTPMKILFNVGMYGGVFNMAACGCNALVLYMF
ncbi:Protein SRSX-30, partial [Aphelenchoides avenae]